MILKQNFAVKKKGVLLLFEEETISIHFKFQAIKAQTTSTVCNIKVRSRCFTLQVGSITVTILKGLRREIRNSEVASAIKKQTISNGEGGKKKKYEFQTVIMA